MDNKIENAKEWYYEKSGKQVGPVSKDEVKASTETGYLSYGDMVWRKGSPTWVKLEDSDLKHLLADQPPPLQVKTDNELMETNIFLMIFLTVVTAGIYVPAWFLTRKSAINNLQSKDKLDSGIFVFIIVILSIRLLLLFVSGICEVDGDMDGARVLDGISRLLNLITAITLLVQCFKVRRIFNEHFNTHLKRDIPFSGVATFFFTIFYFQYKINRL